MSGLVIMKDRQAVTSSLQVAESFEKRHDNVLRDIDDLKKDVLNFEEMFFVSTEQDSYGRDRRVIYMNRDGFTLLAMGFTGKKALAFKLKYIEAFNKLEKYVKKAQSKTQVSHSQKKRLEIMEENAKTRKATILYKIAMATGSDTSKERLLAEAGKTITGEMVLPIKKQKEYSAGDVAEKIGNGLTANMVGRISNSLNLKAEQPGQNEYGRWTNSKSQYSIKEVPQWMYFDKGMEAIRKEWEIKK